MERGLFDVEVVFKTDEGCERKTLNSVALSDIQNHFPRTAELVSVVANKKRQHKI